MADLDYERIETEPETYFSELAEKYSKECKEVKAQWLAVNRLSGLLGANIQGSNMASVIQPFINTILTGQQGTLEQVLETLGENPEAIQKKREIIHELDNQLGQIYANAGFQGKTSKALDSAREEIKELNGAYDSYSLSSKNAKPVIEKHLKI